MRAPLFSCLYGERLDDRLGDRVGIPVERELAAVEIAHLGRRHNSLHEFRACRQDSKHAHARDPNGNRSAP